MQLFYRPKRLRRACGTPGRLRLMAALLCVSMLLTLFPVAVLAAGGYSVEFVDYDLSGFEGAGYSFEEVPEGARLYTADELEDVERFSQVEGCSWYLYYPGGGESGAFGPYAIPDPTAREGYVFRDWAAQGSSDDAVYTVTGNTIFTARYASQNQYVINLYYQFDNESNTVAAETTTTPYGWSATISMLLPQSDSLSGLTPRIMTRSGDEAVQAAVARLNGMLQNGYFTGELNQSFMEDCVTAGFAAWDAESGDYFRDENGNVQIKIPVTYALTGEVAFQVEYYQQNAQDDGYTLMDEDTVTHTVEGTTRVSLNELGLVESYEGFELTAASAEDADSYNVSADGSSVIRLYYDRNIHYIYYQMNGGNVVDPVPLRYGQTIPETVGTAHDRPGYEFEAWTWLDAGGEVIQKPSTMPDHDLTLEADWVGADTEVTLVYWLENANDDNYTIAGQQTITVTSGQTVGYQMAEGSQSTVDVSINDYLSADAMEAAGIPDGEYFTFAYADSSTQWPEGIEGAPKTAEGDGSTVINLGYSRNEYTLVFHLGWESFASYRVVSGGASSGQRADDWKSGYESSFLPWGGSPEMNIGGRTYTITDDPDGWYQFTAKYGEYISDMWPVREMISPGGWTGWRPFYGWGTHNLSLYAQKHTATNGVINGIYSTMSSDLIIDPQNTQTAHHLVAYFDWSTSGNVWTYHYLFEAVPGTGETGEEFAGSNYETYQAVKNVASNGLETVQGLRFYQYGSAMTILSLEGVDAQNAPIFSNVTYQYGCYSGSDIYFFYTYNDYTLTYHENNANLTPGAGKPAQTKTVGFHYVDGKPVAQLVDDADYTPEDPFISSYGNAYRFGGWYTTNSGYSERYAVDWDTFAPESNVNLYAQWIAPTFTLTLIVPGGTLYQDSLDQFTALGYEWTCETKTDADGEVTSTYIVTGVPGGTKAGEIVSRFHGAQSSHSLAFDYWGYEVDGTEQRYLFDESQLVTADLTLTARWKTQYTGQYTVRYLTEVEQDNGLSTVEIEGKTYYRLLPDKTVAGVAVGSSVTEEARPVEGYLSETGDLTQVVEAADAGVSRTCFDFLYDKIAGEVTYHVHYVRDTGVDYGRDEPAQGIVRLAEDKTVTLDAVSLKQSTTVSEEALVLGGYTPRDSWNVSFTLSADESQNHLYIYYVSNTYEVDFSVIYHFALEDGSYAQGEAYTFQLTGTGALGKVLYARDLASDYQNYLQGDAEGLAELESKMVGHTLDTEMTSPLSLLLTRESAEIPGQTGNVIHIYMKNAAYTLTYSLNDGEDPAFPARWDNADTFLTPLEDGSRQELVTYPNGATVPQTAPDRLSYTFVGWNTQSDGSGTGYTPENLGDAVWYQPGGLVQDQTLYAQWEKQLTVTFDLRGGTWTDTGSGFYQTADGVWYSYATAGQSAPRPADPTLVTVDGIAHSFIGWTTTDPDGAAFVGDDNRVDLVEFERYRFDFSAPVTRSVTLYAVWDPDVTTFELLKTDTGDVPLTGAEFTLERLKASVTANGSGGYDYELQVDENGDYLPDETFVVRTVLTGQDGMGKFEHLPAGYYRLTETQCPEGYTGLSGPVILFAPYQGEAYIASTQDAAYVSGTQTDDGLLLTVQNILQYSITITAPESITLTYLPPDFIWNPETMEYESADGSSGQWTVSAQEGGDAFITVSNDSQSGSMVEVLVSLRYGEDWKTLLSMSTLSGSDGFTYEEDSGEKRRAGTLAARESAQFAVSAAGTLPPGTLLPTTETMAGSITVYVSKPNG